MRIVYKEETKVYLVQLEAHKIEERFGINCNCYGNLSGFRKEIYTGPQEFDTFEEAKLVMDKVTDKDMFIGNFEDSKLKEVVE